MKKVRGLSELKRYAAAVHEATKKSVVVGLPKGKATSRVYKDGATVLDVGAKHEYGYKQIPMRSFLRLPFMVYDKKLRNFVLKQFRFIAEKGKKVDAALGLIGIFAENTVKESFVTKGFGQWKPLSPRTIAEKGSSQILIDTGILRSSILSEVRDQ